MRLFDFLRSPVDESDPDSVKVLLHKRLRGYQPARDHGTVHASDIIDKNFCPRQFALMDALGVKPKDEFLGTAQRVTFSYGHFIQDRISNEWLADLLRGIWACLNCGATSDLGPRPNHKCPACSCNLWRYEELVFTDPQTGAVGSVDVILSIRENEWPRIVEIKSIDKDQFKDLKAPMAKHRVRTMYYLMLAEAWNKVHPEAQINDQVGHVVYVAKSYGFKDETVFEYLQNSDSPFSPFKEYLVKRDDKLLVTPRNRALALHLYRQGKAGMPCGICKAPTDTPAKGCRVKHACFGPEYPAKITWYEKGAPKHLVEHAANVEG